MVGQGLWCVLCCPRLFPIHPAQGGLSHPQRDTEVLGGGRFQGDQAREAVRAVEVSGGGNEGTEACLPRPKELGGGAHQGALASNQPRPEKVRQAWWGQKRLGNSLEQTVLRHRAKSLCTISEDPSPKPPIPPILPYTGMDRSSS